MHSSANDLMARMANELWYRYMYCKSKLPEAGGDMPSFVRCTCRYYKAFCNGTVPTRSPIEKVVHRSRIISHIMAETAKIDYDLRLPTTPAPEPSGFALLLWSAAKILGFTLAALAGLVLIRVAAMWLCVDRPRRQAENGSAPSAPGTPEEGGTSLLLNGEGAAGGSRQALETARVQTSPRPDPSAAAAHREALESDSRSAASLADNPPAYRTLRPQTPAPGEEPPPSYQEVCHTIHC